MISKLARIIALAPLLLAFQCDEETGPVFAFNEFKVEVSANSAVAINETIWIEGMVSSLAYDLSARDSVFNDLPQADVFSIYRLVEPDELSNAKDAFDKFELSFEAGDYSFLPRCENAQVQVVPVLDASESFYRYKVGLKALEPGDYVISWQSATLLNENRNEYIIEDYPITNHPDQIGFNSCGELSWRFVDESTREFYFSVTQ